MKISDSEKLILTMLSQIHQKLEIDNDIDPEFIEEAICTDNTWAISWKYNAIPFENIKTPPHVKKTIDILTMWNSIEGAYSKLSDDDKSKLEAIADLYDGRNLKFPGFGGNDECKYLNVAKFLTEKLGRFSSFKGRIINSHMPMLDLYSRMYSVFEPIKKKSPYEQMSVEQLGDILKGCDHHLIFS